MRHNICIYVRYCWSHDTLTGSLNGANSIGGAQSGIGNLRGAVNGMIKGPSSVANSKRRTEPLRLIAADGGLRS